MVFGLLPTLCSCLPTVARMSKMRLRRSRLAKKQEPGPRLSPLPSTTKVRGRCGGRQGTRKKSAPARPNSEWRPNRRKAAPNRRKSVKNVGNFGRSDRLVKAVACACISPWAQHAERPGDRMPR